MQLNRHHGPPNPKVSGERIARYRDDVLRGDSENQLVRTFRPRRRRLGAEIGAVYESLIDRYRIDEVGDRVDLGSVFGDRRPVMLEIGCGRGDLAVSFATQHR
ncbi:MAG: hypothetical protein EBZ93_09160, partial [Actinobacteria bacterium]|nr:hypothetical protein [Actinomycetota bacterium]